MTNPYWGNDFFEFFVTLAVRLKEFLLGGFSHMQLASDELQMLVLILISISSALVGTFLVLRRMTMLANALSHTILAGVVIAFLAYHAFIAPSEAFDFSHLLPSDALLVASAFICAMVTTFLTQSCIRFLKVPEDASTGIVFTFLFAAGIVLVTALSRNAHIGIELLMGNVDALQQGDLQLVFWVFVTNCLLFFLFWRAFFVTTFDPVFAHIFGLSNMVFGYLMMALVALSSIAAFRAVGVLMVLAFFVTPVLVARLWIHRLCPLAFLACAIGVATSIVGVALSRHLLSVMGLACSTSAIVVTLLFLLLLGCIITKKLSYMRVKKGEGNYGSEITG
ncbi:MAG: metal ABC transporter permease [Verrucomicrobia bacterium]|nr:metal ABC transporter permease [Verrucomicrobiota bacterium]